MWSQSEKPNEKPRCERSHMGIFLSVTLQASVHLGKDCTETEIYQESTTEILETVVSSDSKADH